MFTNSVCFDSSMFYLSDDFMQANESCKYKKNIVKKFFK